MGRSVTGGAYCDGNIRSGRSRRRNDTDLQLWTRRTSTGENLGMDRPLLVAMDGRGEDDLEAEAIRELCEVAGRWARTLPVSSPWQPACMKVQRWCALSLRQRSQLLHQPSRAQAG